MQTFDLRAKFLPYCIHRRADGRFLLLNRNYKPLGVTSTEWADYDTNRDAVELTGFTDRKAEKIGLEVDGDGWYYLYDDTNSPMRTPETWERYCKILREIMQLVVHHPL